MYASYATPTPHLRLLAAPAITPAQFVPCLLTQRKFSPMHSMRVNLRQERSQTTQVSAASNKRRSSTRNNVYLTRNKAYLAHNARLITHIKLEICIMRLIDHLRYSSSARRTSFEIG